MNVKIQSVKFDADIKLVEFVENKLEKMSKFAENAISAEVILKLDKDNDRGNKVATIKLELPGSELFAEHRSKTFEESVDETVVALKKQLEKYKEKHKE